MRQVNTRLRTLVTALVGASSLWLLGSEILVVMSPSHDRLHITSSRELFEERWTALEDLPGRDERLFFPVLVPEIIFDSGKGYLKGRKFKFNSEITFVIWDEAGV